MNMPKLTKKDKRSHAEIKMDELIDQLADEAASAEEASKVLHMMKDREEVEKAKKPKIDPMLLSNLINAGVGIFQVAAIIKAEKIDFSILTSKAMGFVHKGRLR